MFTTINAKLMKRMIKVTSWTQMPWEIKRHHGNTFWSKSSSTVFMSNLNIFIDILINKICVFSALFSLLSCSSFCVLVVCTCLCFFLIASLRYNCLRWACRWLYYVRMLFFYSTFWKFIQKEHLYHLHSHIQLFIYAIT